MSLTNNYKKELLDSIPVVKAMDIDIEKIEPKSLTISAPLNTNINYEGTAFGGSLNTACVLSCYLLIHHILKTKGIEFNSLVIQNSTIDYKMPVQADFFAKSSISEKSEKLLLNTLEKKGIGRASVVSKIQTNKDNEDLVEFRARFVVKK